MNAAACHSPTNINGPSTPALHNANNACHLDRFDSFATFVPFASFTPLALLAPLASLDLFYPLCLSRLSHPLRLSNPFASLFLSHLSRRTSPSSMRGIHLSPIGSAILLVIFAVSLACLPYIPTHGSRDNFGQQIQVTNHQANATLESVRRRADSGCPSPSV